MCRIRVWTSYAFNQVSAWILVSMTIRRALGIVWPHRTRTFLTKRLAKNAVAFVVSVGTLSSAHTLYGHPLAAEDRGGQKAVCYYSFASERYGEFFNGVWVDMVLAVALPFLCLLVTNSV